MPHIHRILLGGLAALALSLGMAAAASAERPSPRDPMPRPQVCTVDITQPCIDVVE